MVLAEIRRLEVWGSCELKLVINFSIFSIQKPMQKLGELSSQQLLVRFHSESCVERFRHWRTPRSNQNENITSGC